MRQSKVVLSFIDLLSNQYTTDTAINVQKKQDKMKNNDLQNITQKTKIEHPEGCNHVEQLLRQVVLSFIDLLSLSIEISLLNERVRVMVFSTIIVLTELSY
jgi:hypothetical protein